MKRKLLTVMLAIFAVFAMNAQTKTFSTLDNPYGLKKDVSISIQDANPAPLYYQKGSKEIVEIGTGTDVAQRYPIYAYFGYSYTQTIFLASEIGVADNISKIWYYFAGTSLNVSNDWTIYMGHTSKTQFDSNTDWVPVANMTQVYSGVFTDPGGPGWIEFDITDFAYNGTDNLVIAVDENAANYNGTGDRFYCTSGLATDRSLVYFSDTNNPDPSAPPTSSYFGAETKVIPNIRLLMGLPDPHDLGVTGIEPSFVSSGNTVTPQVSIHNYGTEEETVWSVELTDGGSYTETVTNPGTIGSGADAVVDFPAWTPADGSYTLTATVTVAGDAVAANDVLEQNCDVMNSAIAYASYWTGSNSNGELIVPTDEFTAWGISTQMIRGMAHVDETLYGLDATGNLGTINMTDGTFTTIGPLGPTVAFWTNLAYDPIEGDLYAFSLSGTYPGFTIGVYTVDMVTGVATLVANSSHTGTAAIFAFDESGNLFAVEHQQAGNGLFYSVNKTTAEMTLIGDMGMIVSSNFQGMSWDKVNNNMWFQASGAGAMQGSYKIDLTTGEPSLIGIPFTGQIMGFVIPIPMYDVTFNVDVQPGIDLGFIVGDEVADSIFVTGSPWGWTVPGTVPEQRMTDGENDNIYTLTKTVEGGEIQFKFFVIPDPDGGDNWAGGEWDGDPNRTAMITENTTLDLVWGDIVTVEDVNANIHVSVYPNPSNGLFYMHSDNSVKMEVYDMTGRLIKNDNLNGNTTLQLNNTGVYLIKFSNAEGSTIQRVVVK